jgi:hypothetical protein
MSEFLQAWLKDSIINIITEVFQNEYKGSNIENEIKILSFKKNPRVQIDKFLKCPTSSNPDEECISIVVDKCNYISATFSPAAIQKFKLKNPEIEMTSLRGYYIILNEYNFDYERKARQLYLNIEEFNYISGEATVYSNDIQFINDIPSIQAFIAILNQEINEENQEEIYHYGWDNIIKVSDEDCYISSEDRNILDNLPGWTDSDSTISEVLSNKQNNIINENYSLFNSQSIFEIADFKEDNILYNRAQSNESPIKEKKKTEKRYRESVDSDINSSENEKIIDENYNKKRIKVDNSSLSNETLFFSQPIDIFHQSHEINIETNSDFSNHLSVSTDENLTNKFAPAGKYSSSSRSHSSISENNESEIDKVTTDTYTENGDKNNKSFNINKTIEKANLCNNSFDDNGDEILYESQNFEIDSSPNSRSFIDDNSIDPLSQFNLLEKLDSNQNLTDKNENNELNDFNDNMISDNYQYMNKTNSNNSSINLNTEARIPINQNINSFKNVNNIPQELINEKLSNNTNEEEDNDEEINLLQLKTKLNEKIKKKRKSRKNSTSNENTDKSNEEKSSKKPSKKSSTRRTKKFERKTN